MGRLANLRAQLRAELARRELHRRKMVASFGDFFRGAWSQLEGEKRFEEDFQHRAMFMHAQIMVEEWHLAGLEPEQIGPQLDAWELEGRPYVEDYREHWNGPGCGGGAYVQRATDLAVNVGPISLKSRIFMVGLLAWIWLWCPSFDGFFSSGTPSNVTRDALACRDLVSSPWYRSTFHIEWEIRDDLDRVQEWGIGIRRDDGTWQGLGKRQSLGSGASVTGVHADGLFFDDPDDAKGVWSEAERRDTQLFWDALGNRLKDPRRPLRFLIQQNLHPEDLSSKCVKKGMPRLAIPVVFKPDRRARLYTAPFKWRDPRNDNGEVLQPTRNTPRQLAAERLRLGSFGFEAQYNCDPRSLDGGIIKRHWWRFFLTAWKILPKSGAWVSTTDEARSDYERPPGADTKVPAIPRPARYDRTTMAVDLIFGGEEDPDFASILVWSSRGPDRFLLGRWHKQEGFDESLVAIEELDKEFPGCKKLIERAANGWATIQTLKKKLPAVIAQKPIGNKAQRLASIAPTVEAGNCYIPLGPDWVEQYVEELSGATGYDDEQDTTSYAILDLNLQSGKTASVGGALLQRPTG